MRDARRRFLKSSGVAMGSLFVPMSKALAKGDKQEKLRLRRPMSDPLDPDKLANKRRRIIEKYTKNNDESTSTARRGPIELADNEHIVAYNFDLINGAPSEWMGIAASKANRGKEKRRPHVSSTQQSSEDIVQDIHNKAHHNAKQKEKKKENEGGVTIQDSESKWWDDDWEPRIKNDHYRIGENGHKTGWTVEWKSHPSESDVHGLHAQLRMYPYTDGIWDWKNNFGKVKFEFNPDDTDIEDHEPGNTIGQSTTSWNLNAGTDSVNIGISGSTTSSNLDIDDDSDIDGNKEHITHKWTVNGDLVRNSLFLDTICTMSSEGDTGDEFADIDLISEYILDAFPPETETIDNYYSYYW